MFAHFPFLRNLSWSTWSYQLLAYVNLPSKIYTKTLNIYAEVASKSMHLALVTMAFIETVIEARIELLSYSQDENSAGVRFSLRLFCSEFVQMRS